jgi:hypothetical protein
MTEKRRLQVFVSSTFDDLKEERQAAVAAILNANHIPAGMELFSAGDQSQMEVIKKWIDESDVFLLILGGRYGSIEPESQKSYTHLEYEYALKKDKALFAVVANQQALEQQRLGFGSGLLSQGAGLMGQYYGGQQAAYSPYTNAMAQIQALEASAQQPFNMSAALAQQSAQAGANVGRLGQAGAEFSTRLATGPAATTNPYSTLLGGLGASPLFGTAAGSALTSLFG